MQDNQSSNPDASNGNLRNQLIFMDSPGDSPATKLEEKPRKSFPKSTFAKTNEFSPKNATNSN